MCFQNLGEAGVLNIKPVDLKRLCDIASEAAKVVLSVYQTDFEHWKKKDSSPVTQADLRADELIRKALGRDFPGVFIISEETEAIHSDATTYFLVDPLDGTKEFLKRNGEFTINIGLISNGCAIAGVVHAPALDELYFASQGCGSWKRTQNEDTKIRVSSSATSRPLRIMASRSHPSPKMDEWLAHLERPYEFVPAGSSLKFCRVAEGKADLYPRLAPTNQWDTAAGQSVLENAGGFVLDLSGGPLSYSQNRPMLNPNFVAVGDPSLRKMFD
jgi:3'(2'), 5'-bisphosphate nucleotidase